MQGEKELQEAADNDDGHSKEGSVADDAITRNLRAVYDEVAQEPLPPQFLDLLARLEEAEKRDG